MMRCIKLAVLMLLAGGTFVARADEHPGGAPAAAAEQARGARVELHDGDRVVLLGSSFIERMQAQNYLETMLVTRLPNANVTFRNLGWSGDTVQGIARAVFGTPEEGFARLMKDVREAQPTVILVAYGNNEAHEGTAGLARFEQQLQHLLDELATLGARLALLTPRPYAAKGAALPDPAPYNQVLDDYCSVLRRVAAERQLPLVDLHAAEQAAPADAEATTLDGVQLSQRGYWKVSLELAQLLGYGPAPWRLDYHAESDQYDAVNVSLQEVTKTPQRLRWVLLDRYLPPPFPPAEAQDQIAAGVFGTLRVRGLEAGQYQLLIDGVPAIEADAVQWAAGCALPLRGGHEQVEQMRRVIGEKNELWFHRYRPQNETYLFLFRKHEQGNNAVEIPQFEPLVAEREQQIAALRVPQKHVYELVRIR